MSGAERPTLDTVAAAAGVSRMTVSNAYNRPDQLSSATRERVLAVAAELGYPGPDPAGRSLRRGRAGAVGVILSEGLAYAFTDPGLVSFMRGVSTELGSAGQAMLLIPAESDPDGAVVRDAIVDAFILCAVDEDAPLVAPVSSRRLPFVTSGSPRIPGVPFVGVDNKAGGALAARHLLGLGHRRFGVVSCARGARGSGRGSLRAGIRARVDGFVRAVVEAGLGEDAVTVVVADDNTRAAGRTAIAPLLERRRGAPTAVFAVTDVLALGVLAAARSARVAVPRRLSVIGFDDILEAALSTPPLTTVSQSLFEQGVQAAQLVLALGAGEPARSPSISAELVERGSTAPPARPMRRAAPALSR